MCAVLFLDWGFDMNLDISLCVAYNCPKASECDRLEKQVATEQWVSDLSVICKEPDYGYFRKKYGV